MVVSLFIWGNKSIITITMNKEETLEIEFNCRKYTIPSSTDYTLKTLLEAVQCQPEPDYILVQLNRDEQLLSRRRYSTYGPNLDNDIHLSRGQIFHYKNTNPDPYNTEAYTPTTVGIEFNCRKYIIPLLSTDYTARMLLKAVKCQPKPDYILVQDMDYLAEIWHTGEPADPDDSPIDPNDSLINLDEGLIFHYRGPLLTKTEHRRIILQTGKGKKAIIEIEFNGRKYTIPSLTDYTMKTLLEAVQCQPKPGYALKQRSRPPTRYEYDSSSVELENGLIFDYRLDAPTEWNQAIAQEIEFNGRIYTIPLSTDYTVKTLLEAVQCQPKPGYILTQIQTLEMLPTQCEDTGLIELEKGLIFYYYCQGPLLTETNWWLFPIQAAESKKEIIEIEFNGRKYTIPLSTDYTVKTLFEAVKHQLKPGYILMQVSENYINEHWQDAHLVDLKKGLTFYYWSTIKLLKNQIDKLKDNIKRDGIQKIVIGAAIIHAGSHEALLLERQSNDSMGYLLELPNGTVDASENIIDALKRIIREEVGLEVDNVDSFVGAFDYISGSGKKTRQLNFLVRTSILEIKLNPAKHTGSYDIDEYFSEYDSLDISDGVRHVLYLVGSLHDTNLPYL